MREPLLGAELDVAGLAERDRGALPGYLDVEQVRALASSSTSQRRVSSRVKEAYSESAPSWR